MNAQPLPLKEYYAALKAHDWHYSFSDDPGWFDRGYKADRALSRMKDASPEHRALYSAFCAHHFSGPAWRTEQVPLPGEPHTALEAAP